MKNLIWIFALLFALAACSKEEAAPAETAAVVEEQSDEVTEAVEETAAATDETLEVVEESASEAEPADEAIVLAVAESTAATHEWKFKEGEHYVRMVPTQPTVGGADKIEVAEFFWYGCPHCYDFEPYINRWDESKPANVRFVRIPAMWNQMLSRHAQLFYTPGEAIAPAHLWDAFQQLMREWREKGNLDGLVVRTDGG